MGGSARSSNSRLSATLVAVAALSSACVEELPPLEGTTSLEIELISPTETGDVDNRLDDSARAVLMSITALDTMGEPDTSLTATLDLYVHFLGSLSPPLDSPAPFATVAMANGVADNVTFDLPSAFGPTVIWVEHARGDTPTYATGTSPTLWYRDPFLVDISRPEDESALDALESSPLEDKQVNVTASRYGAVGRMVVTAVYAQGYSLSDVECEDADGTPPCLIDDYDSIYVYTHNRPDDEENRNLYRGHVVDRLTGSIAEFNGLTEVNFPQSFVSDTNADEDRLPDPVVIQLSWLTTPIELERVESALVAVEDGEICPVEGTEEWEVYSQWKLDIGLGCDEPINVITKGQVPDFNPIDYVDETIPRVVGTLRPVNIGSFHVWIIYPRDAADLTLP